MSNLIQSMPGTKDIIGDEFKLFNHVLYTASSIAKVNNFTTWTVPIFESTSLFKRSVGESSDIVTKEMYNFIDKGGNDITLRPELTASITRALIENGQTQNLPLKVFSQGPVFRFERPQSGRFREFNQIDFEILGASEPFSDADIINVGVMLFKNLGVYENIVLEINTLGDKESRDLYRSALIEYFTPIADKLSPESQNRLVQNPLRILDSKNEIDLPFLEMVPEFSNYLNVESLERFEKVKTYLDMLEIQYIVNPKLVRGLDYYSHTVFEFKTNIEDFGAQNTVMAGGRYNDLSSELGGPGIPSIGLAGGVERICKLIRTPNFEREKIVYFVPISPAEENLCILLMNKTREAGIICDIGYKGNVKKRMEFANKRNAQITIIIGQNEAVEKMATVKIMDSGESLKIPFSELVAKIKEL